MKCSDCPFHAADGCTWGELTTPAYGHDWPAPCEEEEPPEPEEEWAE